MRKVFTLLAATMLATMAWAQTSLRGVLTTADGTPIVDAKVTLGNQGISTNTNSKGEFVLLYLEPISEEVVLSADNYLSQVKLIDLQKDQTNDLGTIALKEDISTQTKQDVTVQLSDDDLDADDDGKGQAMASASSAQGDVFTNYISYAWSSARYRVRGYEQKEENTYINGISFNGLERGMFSYSSLGGLNDASRNKDVYNGIEANGFTFGGIGSSTNILMNAARFARGWKVGLAASNRNYKGRVTATYGTGVMDNGWAFAANIGLRYSPYIDQKGALGEGIKYSSLGYFFSAEKRYEDSKGGNHDFNIVTFGSPTERGQNAAVTQEVYYLTNSIYYNPYWGYQNGKVRNSRIVKSFDPTVLFNYEWKSEDGKHDVKAGVAYHYSMYSNSALTFYNAPDPRPDYYRNLPSYLWDGQVNNNGNFIENTFNGAQGSGSWSGTDLTTNPFGNNANGMPSIDAEQYNTLTNLWKNRDDATTQINWNSLYAANYAQNAINPTGSARYILERRHNDLMETAFNGTYQGRFVNNHLKFTAGLEYKTSKGMHYKTVDDLLGGNQWIDVDAFAERDMKELANNVGMTQAEITNMQQNDLKNPDRAVKEGDRFGYDYNINMNNLDAWAQNEWSFQHVDFYYGFKLTYNDFQRDGKMDNGRAWYLRQVYNNADYMDFMGYDKAYLDKAYKSYGKGYLNSFVTPAAKVGLTYKIDGHNRLHLNALYEQKPPLARDAYISQRLYDRTVVGLTRSKDYSVDLTYEWNYSIFRGRLTGFYTEIKDQTKQSGYYDDGYNTFINYAITGLNQRNAGVELGASVRLGTYFTLSGAFSYMDNRYTSDAAITSSAENGMAMADYTLNGSTKSYTLYEVSDSIHVKGLHVATGPQLVGSLKLSFFHPKMWFADVTITYYDHSYLDFAPSRRSYGFMDGKTAVSGTNADISLNPLGNTVCTTSLLQHDDEGNILYDKNGAPEVAYPYNKLTDQESLVDDKIWNRFMVDFSVGKLIYLKNRQSLSVNLSVSNALNNTHFKTGGYQQGRIPSASIQQAYKQVGNGLKQEKVVSNNVWKYPAKYYYAWGANFFLSLTYKF